MMIETTALQAARQAFETQGLPWPPLPDHLASQLTAQGEHLFATRALPASPYAIEQFLAEALAQPALDDYVAVGFAGYGVNSWAAHCFIVQAPLALFIQVPWGGIYTDAEASRAQLHKLFDWSSRLLPLAQACARAGRAGAGERLVVVASEFVPPRWAWVQAPVASGAAIDWNPGTGMLAGVEQALAQRLPGAGRTTP